MIFFMLSLIIFNVAAFIIPKRLNKLEICLVALQAYAIGQATDLVLGINYKLYVFFTRDTYLPWVVAQIGLYPSSNIILLNFFPFDKSLKYKAFHVLSCSVFCVVYEILSFKSGYFLYTGWKTWYSLPYYLFVFSILDFNLSHIRKWREIDVKEP